MNIAAIFAPTHWDVHHPNDPKAIAAPKAISSVEQRHPNVGGGYATDLLPQVSLRWDHEEGPEDKHSAVRWIWTVTDCRRRLRIPTKSLPTAILEANRAALSDDRPGAGRPR